MKDKILKIGLTILGVFTCIGTTQASFPDLPDFHPNKMAIEYLQDKGVVSGSGDGNFYPNRVVNRAEFLKMALISSGITESSTVNLDFKDVKPGVWFYSYVREAFARTIIQGYPDGTFQPSRTVSKVEALKMLLKTHEIKTIKPKTAIFNDVRPEDWYSEFVSYAIEKKLLETTNVLFDPSKGMTRGEIAEVIYRLMTIKENGFLPFVKPKANRTTTREILETNGILHSVPLESIVPGGPPKDGIPSIDNPQFIQIEEANSYLDDEGVGIAVAFNGINRFYPYQILAWHEIINDNIGGQPVAITYCPLSETSVAFEPTVNGEALQFGTTGKLWNSNLVMYDRKTDSYWSQILGEAIVGQLAGVQLNKLPFVNVTYGSWKQAHPNGQVLSQKTGYIRDYSNDPYGAYYSDEGVYFNLDSLDDRFRTKEPIFGIQIGKSAKAYPKSELEKGSAQFSDDLDGLPLNITFNKGTKVISIRRTDTNENLIPISGLWFSWIAVHPDSQVYTAPQK